MRPARERQVVVLAGGLGSRLRDLDGDLPKALRPVGGRPFLDVMLDPFLRQELRRFHFCLGDGGDQLVRHLAGLDSGLELTYEVEPTPCGTGGALLRSAVRLDEVFLLAMGDTYCEIPYPPLFEALPEEADGLLVVTGADSGVTPNVALAGRTVAAYDKRGVRGGWTDTGLAVLRRRSLRALRGVAPPIDLSTLFGALIERGALRAAVTDRRFHDIGTPERYRAFCLGLVAGDGGLARC